MSLCERCRKEQALRRERYCKRCRKDVLHYLTEHRLIDRIYIWRVGMFRTAEMKENTRETKYGVDR